VPPFLLMETIKLLAPTDVIEVSCAACYASVGDFCRTSNKPNAPVREQRLGIPLSQFHDARIMRAWRKRYNIAMPANLSQAKIAQITNLAFIQLSEAVSAYAEAIYGHPVHPAHIQAEFIATGIEELFKIEKSQT
jgi:hypothetical protein